MKKIILLYLSLPCYLFSNEIPSINLNNKHIFLLLTGLSFGLIIMAAIYNFILFFYHKKRVFIYYTLMQIGIVQVLLYDTGIITTFIPTQNVESIYYDIISLFSLFFIIQFTRSFLFTNIYLPRHDKLLKTILFIILIDTIIYFFPFIFGLGIFFFIFLYIIIISYKRIKQGYKPAKFFFIGWSAFLISNIIDAFIDFNLNIEPYTFNPMFIGIIIESITLALAISFQFKELELEKEIQKQILIHQTKLASLGEMLGNISHQWKQPLNRLSYILMNIETADSKQEILHLLYDANYQIEYMSNTINDFKDFYLPSKQKENFSLAIEIKNVLKLIYFKNINISLNIVSDTIVYNYKNEFKQVIINILSNAKDALYKNKIDNPFIEIKINKSTIYIEDNAKGIALDNINKIFKPYFTTKNNSLGIGLYMSKIITKQKLNAQLSVKNSFNGAIFILEFNK